MNDTTETDAGCYVCDGTCGNCGRQIMTEADVAAVADLQEALDCARDQRHDLLELLDVEREQHAEALRARLTHAEREVLRPVIARYAQWPDAHDGPVFEAVEGILAGRATRVLPPDVDQS